jgi:hypothetical protein
MPDFQVEVKFDQNKIWQPLGSSLQSQSISTIFIIKIFAALAKGLAKKATLKARRSIKTLHDNRRLRSARYTWQSIIGIGGGGIIWQSNNLSPTAALSSLLVRRSKYNPHPFISNIPSVVRSMSEMWGWLHKDLILKLKRDTGHRSMMGWHEHRCEWTVLRPRDRTWLIIINFPRLPLGQSGWWWVHPSITAIYHLVSEWNMQLRMKESTLQSSQSTITTAPSHRNFRASCKGWVWSIYKIVY